MEDFRMQCGHHVLATRMATCPVSPGSCRLKAQNGFGADVGLRDELDRSSPHLMELVVAHNR